MTDIDLTNSLEDTAEPLARGGQPQAPVRDTTECLSNHINSEGCRVVWEELLDHTEGFSRSC